MAQRSGSHCVADHGSGRLRAARDAHRPPSLSLVESPDPPQAASPASPAVQNAIAAAPAPLLEFCELTVAVRGQTVIAPLSLQVASRGMHLWVVDGGVQHRLLLELIDRWPDERRDGHRSGSL